MPKLNFKPANESLPAAVAENCIWLWCLCLSIVRKVIAVA